MLRQRSGLRTSRRGDQFAVLALLLLVLASWMPRLEGPIDLRWDAAVYYILGTSLSEGKGYRLLNEPGEIRAVLYPPLLPVVVAAHQRALRTNDPVIVGSWLRRTFSLMFAAFVFSTYALLRTAARPQYALLGTFVCALTYLPVWLSDRCYTDLPFALTVVLFAWMSERAGRPLSDAWTWASAAAAFLLRTIGAALLLAWMAESVVRRRYRQAAFRFALAVLPIAGWQLYVHHAQNDGDYVRPAYAYQRADYNIYNVTYSQLFSFRDHLDPELGKAGPTERILRIPYAIPRIVVELGSAISAPWDDWELAVEHLKKMAVLKYVVPWRAIGMIVTFLGALTVAGLVVRLVEGHVRLPFAAVVYLAGLATMPGSYFFEIPRYLSVIAPVAMLFALHAIAAIHRHRQAFPHWSGAIGGVVCGALAAAILALDVGALVRGYTSQHRAVTHENWNGHRVHYRLFTFETDYEDLDRGLMWLARHAAPADIIASTTPHWVFLRTGLKAVFPPFERNVARANQLMDSVPVRYVVVLDWLSRRYALEAVRNAPSAWQVVYSNNHCTIYERMKTEGVASKGP